MATLLGQRTWRGVHKNRRLQALAPLLVCSEIRQVVKLGVAASKHAAKGLGAGLQHVPLLSHATYRRGDLGWEWHRPDGVIEHERPPP